MQIRLAGYNLDKHFIDQLDSEASATPEVLAAAYARISRSSKNVTELRADARKEIHKARASNQNIIFDLIGISRYLAEFIQRSRLASFTEKSQRYVTLHQDFVIPEDIAHTPLQAEYEFIHTEAFELYNDLYEFLKRKKATQQTWKHIRDLEGAAKEDARYILPLSTKTQMGMTINARSFELLLRRLSSIPLLEAAQLHAQLYAEVSKVSPSLIRYVSKSDFEYRRIQTSWSPAAIPASENKINLISHTEQIDDLVLTGMIFEAEGGEYATITKQIKLLSDAEKQQLWKDRFADLKPWHKMPRAFELADFTMELTMSSSCFAQFKRHRLCTILKAPYTASDGYTLPSSLQHSEFQSRIDSILHKLESLASKLKSESVFLYPYALANAHRVRIVVKMNLRELYHFVRLRSDAHAQWEIRDLSVELERLIKPLCPLATRWLMGKSAMASEQ
jgi:thymidylate synthase ThyX